MQRIKGYKTVAFNVVMTALLLIRAWQPEAELPTEEQVTQSLDAIDQGLIATWGLGNVVLRAVTNSPIFKRAAPEASKPANA